MPSPEDQDATQEWEDETVEVTRADDEWPVPPEYRQAAAPVPPTETTPAGPSAPAPPQEPLERQVPPPARRRLPPPAYAGVLGIALLAVVGGIVLALALRGDPAAQGQGPAGVEDPPPVTATAATDTTETDGTTPPEAAVSVPDVSGLQADEARRRLAERGLEPRVREVESERPEGQVVGQAPEPEREVDEGTTVVLTVSAGPERIAVPDVVGLSRSRAEAALREAGLDVDVRTSASTRSAGTVLEQAPAADARVEPETSVRLVVAVEPEPPRVKVPGLVGLPVADARQRLGERGLRARVTRVDSPRPAGTVLRQEPRAGSRLQEGQVVRLEVSSGPVLVAVPDVVGLDEASARAELEAAGFRVSVSEEETTDPGQDGVVVAQSPGGGARAEQGARVTLTVGLFV